MVRYLPKNWHHSLPYDNALQVLKRFDYIEEIHQRNRNIAQSAIVRENVDKFLKRFSDHEVLELILGLLDDDNYIASIRKSLERIPEKEVLEIHQKMYRLLQQS